MLIYLLITGGLFPQCFPSNLSNYDYMTILVPKPGTTMKTTILVVGNKLPEIIN